MKLMALASDYINPFVYNEAVLITETSSRWNIYNAFTDTNSDTMGSVRNANNGTIGMAFCGFDVSTIPENSVITNVYFKVKLKCETYYITDRRFKVYVGNIFIKEFPISSPSTTPTIYTFEDINNLTIEDLKNIRLMYQSSISDNKTSFEDIYGIELHVEYEEPTTKKHKMIPSNFKTPMRHNACHYYTQSQFPQYAIDNVFTDVTSTSFAFINSTSGGLHDIAFTEFNIPEISDDYEILSADVAFKTKHVLSYITDRKLLLYSGGTLLYEFPMNNLVSSLQTYHFTLDEFKKEYLNNLSLVFQYSIPSGYSSNEQVYGMEINLTYGKTNTSNADKIKVGSIGIKEILVGSSSIKALYKGEQKIYG